MGDDRNKNKANNSVPKTSFTLSIGITGHRNIRTEDLSKIEESVIKVLEYVKHTSINNIGSGKIKTISYRLISPLAEGADRIAAFAALKCGYSLHCPLPFRKDDYEKDFLSISSKEAFNNLLNKAESVFEVTDRKESKSNSYLKVGEYVLKNSNLLVSIWDGKESNKIGGTADITKKAIKKKTPVIWINTNDPMEINLIENEKAFVDWKLKLKIILNGIELTKLVR